jgi:hypothetical protein
VVRKDCSAFRFNCLVTVMETPAGSEMILSVLFISAMLVFPAPLLALPTRHTVKVMEGHTQNYKISDR